MIQNVVCYKGVKRVMEKILFQTLLYDFYGELLTAHQKEIYEKVIFDDLSYQEIANEKGISRQGAHDLVKRCHSILEGYENKLQLVDKFMKIKASIYQIDEAVRTLDESNLAISKQAISKLTDEVIQIF